MELRKKKSSLRSHLLEIYFYKISAVKIIAITSILLLSITYTSAAAQLEIEWQQNLGKNQEDIIYDIVSTSDGGYIAAGMTGSMSSSKDVYVVKLNMSGEVEWENNYGGVKKEVGRSIRQTRDGGYIVGGETYSFNAKLKDCYIVKLSSSGEVVWEQKYGGDFNDGCEAIIQTSDGGYIAAGGSWPDILAGDIYLIKLDPNGIIEWEKYLGSGLEDRAYDIDQTPDGGYIIAGTTRIVHNGDYDMYIVKTDTKGNEEWSSTFGGDGDERAFSIDWFENGYVAAGYTRSYSTTSDMYVVNMDPNGKKVWEITDGGSSTEERAQSIRTTPDCGCIVVGQNNNNTYGGYDVYLFKLDSNGNKLSDGVFGGKNDDYGYAVEVCPDGGYIIGGQTGSFGNGGDAYVIKTKPYFENRSQTVDGMSIIKRRIPAISMLISFLILVTVGLIIKRREQNPPFGRIFLETF